MTGKLTPEAIKALLTQPTKKPRKKKEIDTNVRDLQTWFKLSPKAIDENSMADFVCENPNCLDDRPPTITSTGVEIKKHFTVEINGIRMCRRCFMAGYLIQDPDQTQLAV